MSYKIKSSLYFACLLVTSIVYYHVDNKIAAASFSDRTEITKADLTAMSSREVTEAHKLK